MKFGLEINNSKTKIMKIHQEGHFSIQGEVIEEVDNFRFLGSQITTSGDSSIEITNGITTAKSTTSSLGSLWKSSKVSINTKVRLAKSLVWSVVFYGCESWTKKKEDEQRLDISI